MKFEDFGVIRKIYKHGKLVQVIYFLGVAFLSFMFLASIVVFFNKLQIPPLIPLLFGYIILLIFAATLGRSIQLVKVSSRIQNLFESVIQRPVAAPLREDQKILIFQRLKRISKFSTFRWNGYKRKVLAFLRINIHLLEEYIFFINLNKKTLKKDLHSLQKGLSLYNYELIRISSIALFENIKKELKKEGIKVEIQYFPSSSFMGWIKWTWGVEGGLAFLSLLVTILLELLK
ncbi:MAG: hypothetical protein PHT54_01385 [Candidatus Nanoarchaeia archaeon]|nr:hypothetical protein [Candidatus Nanoarchaeia archaeon]